ncbi:hypothetical protein NL676_017979 [Syzygium grande]|nr:hypothetical protein NL676_017979 [Syzygium grande]
MGTILEYIKGFTELRLEIPNREDGKLSLLSWMFEEEASSNDKASKISARPSPWPKLVWTSLSSTLSNQTAREAGERSIQSPLWELEEAPRRVAQGLGEEDDQVHLL